MGERGVDDLAVPGDPADIGGAPVDGFFSNIENPLIGCVVEYHIPTRAMDDAFRLAGGPGRVQHVERMRRLHRDRLDKLMGTNDGVGKPMIAALLKPDLLAGPPDDDDLFHTWTGGQRLVDNLFERYDLAPPKAAIGGDDQLGLGIFDPAANGLCAETREDHRMDRADPGAGQHCYGEFRNHRQIQGNAVPFLDAETQQHSGKTVDLAEQGRIAQHPGFAIFTFPVDGHLAASPGVNVPINTLITGVQRSSHKPAPVGFPPLQHAVPRFDPVQLSGLLVPEALRILDGIPMHPGVSLGGPDSNPRCNRTRSIRSANITHRHPPLSRYQDLGLVPTPGSRLSASASSSAALLQIIRTMASMEAD